jgi:uncharacterized protein YodC (DUF2158 family)
MADFKIGDVVQLKSGGPIMTVTRVDDGLIDCVYFNKEKLEQVTLERETIQIFKSSF